MNGIVSESISIRQRGGTNMTSLRAYLQAVARNCDCRSFSTLSLIDFLWLAKSFCCARSFPAASFAACSRVEADCSACLYLQDCVVRMR